MSFNDVLQKYASHHCESGTDKSTSHSYGELYSNLFAPLQPIAKRVLEIGVYSGASVAALADYFTGAEAHGVDINLNNICFGNSNPRVHFHLGDGTKKEIAAQIYKMNAIPFDLILDDGSHRPSDQLDVIDVWAPYLSDVGMLVIEDISVPEMRATFESRAKAVGLVLAEWHDRRLIKGQWDDVVAVFKRPYFS